MTKLAATIEGSPDADVTCRAVKALDLGFHGLGLEPPLHASQWEKLRETLPRESVLCVQVFLPYPGGVRPGDPSPFVLGSLHPEERCDALKFGEETILFAARNSIPVVRIPPIVLEGLAGSGPGRAPRGMPHESPRMAQAAARRQLEAVPRLDSLRSLLYRLLEAADRHGISIALTPGGFMDELPGFEEASALFREFEGAPLRAWPDTLRAAAALEARPGVPPWDSCGGKMAGLTVRDFDSRGEPLPLGGGCLDRDALKPLLEGAPIWLAGPGPVESGDGLEESLRFLRTLESRPENEKRTGILFP